MRKATESVPQDDGLNKFMRFVYKNYPEINSYKRLQNHIETIFDGDFRPEDDQIDYMHKLQKSETYRKQCKTFKKQQTMISNDFQSFSLGLGPKSDDDELSDEDGGDAELTDALSNQDEDYFKGALAHSFAAGC